MEGVSTEDDLVDISDMVHKLNTVELSHKLVFRIVHDKYIKIPAFLRTIAVSWQASQLLEFCRMHNNMFLARFSCRQDLEFVL